MHDRSLSIPPEIATCKETVGRLRPKKYIWYVKISCPFQIWSIFSTPAVEENVGISGPKNFRDDRLYPIFIRTCILLFFISVILTSFWANLYGPKTWQGLNFRFSIKLTFDLIMTSEFYVDSEHWTYCIQKHATNSLEINSSSSQLNKWRSKMNCADLK